MLVRNLLIPYYYRKVHSSNYVKLLHYYNNITNVTTFTIIVLIIEMSTLRENESNNNPK